jgi:hypothetical protein
MNNNGFILDHLYITGIDVPKAEVHFTKGLNVIQGPSEKGKTFIFQCIQFLLGSDQKLKEIPEIKKYDKCFLTIKTYDQAYHTFERSLKGGDILLYENQKDNLIDSKILKVKNNSKDTTISDFLLSICNISNKKIRKNAQGVVQNLYFQDLFRFFMIDEQDIITDESPIAKLSKRENVNMQKTFQENKCRFLLSGDDDSGIITPLKKYVVDNNKGKIELLSELISDNLERIPNGAKISDINSEIDLIDRNLKNLENEYSNLNDIFTDLETNRKSKNLEIRETSNRIITLEEILKRSDILKRQYQSDINRLRATIEAGDLIDTFEVINCPVCNSEIKAEELVDIEQITNSSLIEIQKITDLLDELKQSTSSFRFEKEQKRQNLSLLEQAYVEIVSSIENKVGNSISEIKNKIKEYIKKKQELFSVKTLILSIEKYKRQKSDLESSISVDKEVKKNGFVSLSASNFSEILETYFDILTEMNYEDIGSQVGFSEEYLDFIIARKNRKDYGKGFRAIFYSIFIISILHLLKTKDFMIGNSILDSPLNPYKPDEVRNGEIPNDLAINFYQYLYDYIKEEQVIIIENTDVPENIKEKINYIQYSRNSGFIPTTE